MKKQIVWCFALEAIFCEAKYTPYCHGIGATYKAGIKDMVQIALEDVRGFFEWLPDIHAAETGNTVKKLEAALKSFDDTPAAHQRLMKFGLEVFGWDAVVRQR